jgi:hypothetical protein
MSKKSLGVHNKATPPPPIVHPKWPLWKETLRLQSQWFIYSFVFVRAPKKEPSQEMRGKNTVTFHGAPLGRKAYIECGAAWLIKGIPGVEAWNWPLNQSRTEVKTIGATHVLPSICMSC